MFISFQERTFVDKIRLLDYGVIYNTHSDWLIIIAVAVLRLEVKMHGCRPILLRDKINYLNKAHSLNRFRR